VPVASSFHTHRHRLFSQVWCEVACAVGQSDSAAESPGRALAKVQAREVREEVVPDEEAEEDEVVNEPLEVGRLPGPKGTRRNRGAGTRARRECAAAATPPSGPPPPAREDSLERFRPGAPQRSLSRSKRR
jgi:hypothetical protein